MTARKTGLIYLLRDRFDVYIAGYPTVLEFKFVPEVVRDLDVVNAELLENVIKVFITNSKMPPCNFTMVIGDNASFIKDFVLPAQPQPKNPQQVQPAVPSMEELQKQVDKFIEHIPYDEVASKTFPLKNGMRVYAANKDLVMTIKRTLENLGNTVDMILPGLVFGNNLSAQPVLSGSLANTFLQRAAASKQFNLLIEDHKVKEERDADTDLLESVEEGEEKPTEKTDKKKIILVSSVFGVLIIVLIVVYYIVDVQPMQTTKGNATGTQPQAAVPPQAAVNTPTTAAITQTVPSKVTSTTIGPVDTKNLTVQINNASGSVTSAQTLRVVLVNYGFKSVNLQTIEAASPTLVTFSPQVSSSVRATVLSEIKNATGNLDVRSLDKSDTPNDITITLGK